MEGNFSNRGGRERERGVLQSAVGGGVPSAGGAASGMMLQATVEVPLSAGQRSRWQCWYQSHGERGKGKENDMLGSKGIDQFVRFVSRTAGSNGSIPVRLLPGPISRTGPESWPIDGLTSWSSPVFKTMHITNHSYTF